ncbi:hypothetical protein M5K25_008365 [Dendrobium thyrsiflorum]
MVDGIMTHLHLLAGTHPFLVPFAFHRTSTVRQNFPTATNIAHLPYRSNALPSTAAFAMERSAVEPSVSLHQQRIDQW